MGLRQEVETSFGNQSDRLLPHRSLGRLSWFVAGTLSLVGTHTLPPPAFAQPLTQSTENTRLVTAENPAINPLTLELSSRVTQEIVKPLADKGIDIDLTGELLTNAFLDQEGNRNIVYRNIWFQVGMDGKLTVVPAVEKIRQKLPQAELDYGLYGDPIPLKSDTEIIVGPEVKQFINSLKDIISIGPITGYKNYGPFEIYTDGKLLLGRTLEGQDTETFWFGNTGYQALIAGLAPQEAALGPLPFATGGGNTEILPSPVQMIEGPRKILAVYYQPEAPLEVGPTPTFNQLEEHLFSQGINRLEIKYNNFPELFLPGQNVSAMSICPTNNEPTCETPFIYLKHQVDSDKKSVRLELKLASEVPDLSPQDLDYLNRAFQFVVASYISIMKYGNRMSMIPDAKLKLEAETTLLKPLTEINGLQFIFK